MLIQYDNASNSGKPLPVDADTLSADVENQEYAGTSVAVPPPAFDSDFEEELPTYSTSDPNAPLTHIYTLRNKHKEKWLRLHVRTNTKIKGKLPRILGGQPVEGKIEINLKNPETIKSIVIQVRAVVVRVIKMGWE